MCLFVCTVFYSIKNLHTKLQKGSATQSSISFKPLTNTIIGDSHTQEEVERQFTDKDKLGINNSIAAHIRWRKTYKASVEGCLDVVGDATPAEDINATLSDTDSFVRIPEDGMGKKLWNSSRTFRSIHQ